MFKDAEISAEFESACAARTVTQFGDGAQRSARSAASMFGRRRAGMHIEAGPRYRHATWIPEWSRNDEKLRQVLAIRNKRHKNYSKELTPAQLQGIPLVQLMYYDKHRELVARHGYMELQAAIAWRSWREGMYAKDIGPALGVSAGHVRQSLYRMREIARKLGFETAEDQRHWSHGVKTNHKRKPSITLQPRPDN
jgi:hypothetical protein